VLSRSPRGRLSTTAADDLGLTEPQHSSVIARLMRPFGRRPADAFGWIIMHAVIATILANALFRQGGSHPAPILGAAARSDVSTGTYDATGSLIAMPRPAEVQAPTKEPPAAARSRAQFLAELQRELARRGFYDGPVDGIYGPKMDAAIRDFEASVGLRSTGEPGEPLLQAVASSPLKPERPKIIPQPQASRRSETPSAAESSARVVALQSALTEFGYGQIKLTGVFDEPTKAAIEKFERERKLPVSGQMSDRLMRELAAVTGRPFE